MGVVAKMKGSNNKLLSRTGSWLSDLYRNRHLLFSLIEKDFKGKYRNSALGYLWHVLMPLLLIAIYLLVFTSIFGRSIEDYWVYLSAGVFSFTFFTQSCVNGMRCIISNKGMVTKMAFPREIIVIATTAIQFLAFVISYAILIVLIAVCGLIHNPITLLIVPAVMVVEAVFVTGVVFALSSICVYSHDVMYALGRVIPLTMFVTPIFYLSNIDNPVLQVVLWINPMTYFVEVFHSVIYWGVMPGIDVLLIALLFAVLLLMVGLTVFKKLERGFAERL